METIHISKLLEILGAEISNDVDKVRCLKELADTLDEEKNPEAKRQVLNFIGALTRYIDELKKITIDSTQNL